MLHRREGSVLDVGVGVLTSELHEALGLREECSALLADLLLSGHQAATRARLGRSRQRSAVWTSRRLKAPGGLGAMSALMPTAIPLAALAATRGAFATRVAGFSGSTGYGV
jgi:hypothetical protein